MSNATASNEMTEEQAAALLAELEGGETETETEEFEASEQDLEIATASLEEVPESEGDEDDDDTLAVATKPEEAQKRVGKKAKRTPGPKLAAGAKPSEVIKALLGEVLNEYMALNENMIGDPGQVNALLQEIDKAPKKVGEKVINVVKALKNGNELSKYTAYALGLIATGSMTTADLRQAYLGHPYSAGTANAQSSQMMALLPLLGIAERDGRSSLTLKEGSFMFEALKDMALTAK